MRLCIGVVSVALLAFCTRAERAEERVLCLQVDGMQGGEGGKTGMAGPESVKKALEVLAGVTKGEGIPDTGILSADGRMLDQVVGFLEPKEFAARLRKVLERR